MAEEENKEIPEGEEAPKKGKGKLIIIIAVVLILVLGGGGAALMMMGGEDENAEQEELIVEEQLEASKLEPFIVNLKGGRSFLKLTLMIEFDMGLLGMGKKPGEEDSPPMSEDDLPGALGERKPMIRDAILTVLSSKSATILLTVEGKEQLKEELVEAINDAVDLDEAPVTGVYFLEFLVQ